MSEIKVNSIKGVGASAAAITVNNTDGTCTANITNNLSNRRLTINGAMEVSQRGTSTTTNGYLIDRFTSNLGGIDQMQFTMSQSTDAPSGFRKSLKFDITTAETGGTGSDEYAMVRYITESQDIAHFLYGTSGAKTITLSFHVKAYQTGTYALNLFVGDSGRSYTANYTISQSATWEKKTLTFVGDTGGSEVNVDNGHGLYINWFMSSGTDYKSSNAHFNQWGTLGSATGWAYGHNVDLLNSTDNYFQLAGVQLEVGSVATDFEHRSYGDELQSCKRYYQNVGSTHYGATEGTGQFRMQIPLYPHMRSAPTCTVRTGKKFNTRYLGDTTITTPTTSDLTSKAQNIWTGVTSSGLTAGIPIYGRSQQGADGDFLSASAEL
jgi:hypothetical protein